MSEAANEIFDEYEREHYVTRAEVMNALNDPRSRSVYLVEMAREHSGLSLLQNVLDGDLSEWAEDILDAFRVDKARWSERIIDPKTSSRINTSTAAFLKDDLASTLRRFTIDTLSRTAVDGYNNGQASFTLELSDTVRVDLSGSGEIWVDPGHTASELTYAALFRKVA